MDITALTPPFRRVIIANELSGNLAFVTKFSDPDGVRSGKSGWSFGVCQFDLNNNPLAAACLRQCGFTEAEIAGLKAQTVDAHALEPKLKAAAATIERFDQAQLTSCLKRALNLLAKYSIAVADSTAVLAIGDYDNQYSLSDVFKPGHLIHYLATLKRPVTAKDVLDFKIVATKYGRENPDDCRRRYDNLMRIMQGQAA